MELAGIVENAKPFVVACYLLEGDGFLAPIVYDRITSIQHARGNLTNDALTRAERSPQLWAEAVALYDDAHERAAAFDQVFAHMLPAYDRLAGELEGGRLSNTWVIFRGCRLLDFNFVRAMEVIALGPECIQLLRLPGLDGTRLQDLLGELEQYHERAVAADEDADSWEFWRENQLQLPIWYALARNVALIMTSSASVERLFSLYEGRFSEQQQGALQDYKEASIMLHYNHLQRAKHA
jgi:hypothetical protein